MTWPSMAAPTREAVAVGAASSASASESESLKPPSESNGRNHDWRKGSVLPREATLPILAPWFRRASLLALRPPYPRRLTTRASGLFCRVVLRADGQATDRTHHQASTSSSMSNASNEASKQSDAPNQENDQQNQNDNTENRPDRRQPRTGACERS